MECMQPQQNKYIILLHVAQLIAVTFCSSVNATISSINADEGNMFNA